MLESVAITDIGKRRKLNQDYIYESREKIGNLPNIFIVADGMGGHNGGELASQWTVQTVLDEVAVFAGKNPKKILDYAIQAANRVIRRKASENYELYGMGTTIVAATLTGNNLYVANVGDSRLYVANPNKKSIRQITKDHSMVEEMVRLGGMAKETAQHHPDKHIITRAVGAKEKLQVDFFHEKLAANEIVLLCSDGLTDMLEDAEIGNILYSDMNVEKKAKTLMETANEHGGKDNIAIVLIQ